MKRKCMMLGCLALALLMLSGCSSQNNEIANIPNITQAIGPTVAAAAAPTQAPQSDSLTDGAPMNDGSGSSIFDVNPYDVGAADWGDEPLNEENYDPGVDDGSNDVYDSSLTAVAENTVYPYAGSTPIPLDPVDMPSPTPRPKLSFTYVSYTSYGVGVTFDGPAGWQVDESQNQMMILSEPTAQIKEGQQCIITLSAEPVSSNYSENDLKSHVKQRLDTIYTSEMSDYSPSLTATRYMMGSKGVYANYTGELLDGTQVGGRIMYVCIDRVLYGLEIIYPQGYKEDYLEVFGTIRKSLKPGSGT